MEDEPEPVPSTSASPATQKYLTRAEEKKEAERLEKNRVRMRPWRAGLHTNNRLQINAKRMERYFVGTFWSFI